MDDFLTWLARVNAEISQGSPMTDEFGNALYLSLYGYEDPRIRFQRKAQDPRKPNLTFDVTLDLDWHNYLGL